MCFQSLYANVLHVYIFIKTTTMPGLILLGFAELHKFHPFLFSLLLLVYMATLLANSLIVLIIQLDPVLNTPMHFFLMHLSCLEMFYVSTTTPKMLETLLLQPTSISLLGCAVQMFLFLFFGAAECFLLASMAFDRYLAICNPLRYTIIMSRKVCINMVVGSYMCGTVAGLVHTMVTFHLPFCGVVINHFFCEIQPLLELFCGDTFLIEIQVIAMAMIAILLPFLLIILSYSCIISTIVSMPSAKSRQKAFSTCSSHLLVVTLFYGTASTIYLKPRSSYSPSVDKLLSLSYTVVTPLLNPVIYSLRNKEVKWALRKLWRKLFGV
uniref:Olfactory receptor n=1 Tax=Sphenodon punctatus TaxID=8508 RepID=A0A8D0G8X2_SPHPU